MKGIFAFLFFALLYPTVAVATDIGKVSALINSRDNAGLIAHYKHLSLKSASFTYHLSKQKHAFKTPYIEDLPFFKDKYFITDRPGKISYNIIDLACDAGMVDFLVFARKKLGKERFKKALIKDTSCLMAYVRNWDNELLSFLSTVDSEPSKLINRSEKDGLKRQQVLMTHFYCLQGNRKSKALKMCEVGVQRGDNPLIKVNRGNAMMEFYNGKQFFVSLDAAVFKVLNLAGYLNKNEITLGSMYGETTTSHMHYILELSSRNVIEHALSSIFSNTYYVSDGKYHRPNIELINANKNLTKRDKTQVKKALIHTYKSNGFVSDNDGMIQNLLGESPDSDWVRAALKPYRDANIYDPKSGLRLLEVSTKAGFERLQGFWDYLRKVKSTRDEAESWLN